MNFNLFGPQQQGLKMPQGPSQGLTMPQGPGTGFKIPGGLAQTMNAPLMPGQGGMNPMAMMQLMGAGQGLLGQQQQQQPLPPVYRSPLAQPTPYQPRWRQSLFS